ncbi:MAG: hypothetical protein V3W44_02650 [Dehalococcoidales bacterium]
MDEIICRCGHPASQHADTNGQAHRGAGTGGFCGCVLSKSQAQNHEMWHMARVRVLNQFTDEHLELELKRRETQRVPRQLEELDLDNLRHVCQHHIDCVAKNGRAPLDGETYVCEAAMIAVFGKDVWDWINSKLRQ